MRSTDKGVTLPGDQLRLVSPPSKKAKAPSYDGTFAFWGTDPNFDTNVPLLSLGGTKSFQGVHFRKGGAIIGAIRCYHKSRKYNTLLVPPNLDSDSVLNTHKHLLQS